uniref:C-type lectin domain-containing protein n=1 Tax=Haplochromis burtoni TaxID=8153 RepID=A0A3Q2VYI9_HAPBU
SEFIKKSYCRAAVILLGLLCLFLLIGFITVVFLCEYKKYVISMLKSSQPKLLTDCQGNWVAFSDSLYQVSLEKKSWEESRQDCLQKGAHLMIINRREEQNFVNQFKKSLWIGLTDSETDGRWKWVDGTRMTTSYWNSGEPNGGRSENCGEVRFYDSENSWNDAPCSIEKFWICEKRVSP